MGYTGVVDEYGTYNYEESADFDGHTHTYDTQMKPSTSTSIPSVLSASIASTLQSSTSTSKPSGKDGDKEFEQ